jgi:trk system potassium uptake protein TrkA
MGCGRLGARTAEVLDAAGHEVTILDRDTEAFRRLSPAYRGRALFAADIIDEDVLRQANVAEADVFVALTSGDNTNIMAGQIAKLAFRVPHVICQVKDPIRSDAYSGLGVTTICPTIVGVDAVREEIERAVTGR